MRGVVHGADISSLNIGSDGAIGFASRRGASTRPLYCEDHE